jgi:sugar phosphate isomerase/epimerase
MWGNSITFEDYPLEQALRLMCDLGFDGVEMWKHHLKRCKTESLRREVAAGIKEMGLRLAGLNVVGEPYFQPFGTDEQMQGALDGLKADVEFAQSLGVHDVLIWEGVRPPGSTESDCLTRLLPRLVEFFRAAIAFAAPLKARFLVEPHPFTVGMDDRVLIKLHDALDSPHFGITYDCCHYGVGRPKDYVAVIHALGPRIRHIHLADSDLVTSELHYALGAGCLDLQAILDAFKAIRYDGTLTLDLYGNPMPLQAARRSMALLRQAYEFLGLPQ